MKQSAIVILLFIAARFAVAQSMEPLRHPGAAPLPPKEMFFHGVADRPAGQDTLAMGNLGAVPEKKSVVTAVIYSLLLPGMGELYDGEYAQGKYFTMAEGALWLTWGGFTSYGNWTRNDARNFAAQHAGVSLTDRSDQYFIDIGNFISADAYNQEILRERLSYKIYDTHSTLNWNWDTDNNRERYREMRVQSDETFNYARFAIATVIANHLISAINAGRLTISHNKRSEASLYYLHASLMGPLTRPDGVMLSLSRIF